MIISHKYKFIFIKTEKTAGTSIEVFLSEQSGKSDVVTPIRPHVEPHVAQNHKRAWNPLPEHVENKGIGTRKVFKQLLNRKKYFNHIHARAVKSRTSSRIWNDYFKFCVERNPWDKTLSHYHMIKDRSGETMTFEDYIKNEKFRINYPKYTDRAGNLLVDEVIKYESLPDDLTRIFDELGIPFNGSLAVRAKSEYRDCRRAYQESYSSDHADVIEKAFAKEIQMHGYSF